MRWGFSTVGSCRWYCTWQLQQSVPRSRVQYVSNFLSYHCIFVWKISMSPLRPWIVTIEIPLWQRAWRPLTRAQTAPFLSSISDSFSRCAWKIVHWFADFCLNRWKDQKSYEIFRIIALHWTFHPVTLKPSYPSPARRRCRFCRRCPRKASCDPWVNHATFVGVFYKASMVLYVLLWVQYKVLCEIWGSKLYLHVVPDR